MEFDSFEVLYNCQRSAQICIFIILCTSSKKLMQFETDFGADLQHIISTNKPSWNIRINDVFASISSIIYIAFNINNIILHVVNSPFFSGMIYVFINIYLIISSSCGWCCIIAYHDKQAKYKVVNRLVYYVDTWFISNIKSKNWNL
jgi:hypothetical protein